MIGVALLPMAGSRRVVADKPADKPAAAPSAEAEDEKQEKAAASTAAVSGRITDENEKPVSGATVQFISMSNSAVQETATTRDGQYHLARPWFPGEHRVRIYSDRCLGFTDFNDCPRVVLDAQKPIVRNFTLKVACQVRLQTLDEQGHPIQGARLFKAGPNNPYQEDTDRQGWMTIGGLVPSEYVFALKSDGFVITRLTVKIESPKSVIERKLVLKRGAAIKGTVVCSDGKPAVGWRVVALPSWWDFHSSPMGELIEKDGTFVLPHIGPGAYDVTISFTRPGNAWGSSQLLSNVELVNQKGALTLRVDTPSPASMVMIHGRFRFVGGRPKQGIWISATSSEGQHSSGHWIDGRRRSDDFSLGPVRSGKYRLLFDSPEIESKQIDSVTAPVKDLKVDIQVRGPIVLRGIVDVPGAKGPEPARDFLIRVVKLKNLRGTNFTPSEKWQKVYASRGEFAEQVTGPGIYAVEATADGFATIRSEPINTDQLPKTGIRLTLSKGAVLFGMVVDEERRPVDGAVVMSLAKSGGQLPMSPADIPEGIGVRTVNGRFHFDGLTPGNDIFQVVHPDYALALVQNVGVRSRQQESLTIVMKRGGTVAGHVQDERGRPLAGVSLRFQRDPFTFAGDRYGSRFATAVTDANGYYAVHHLPEELIHILRDQGSPLARPVSPSRTSSQCANPNCRFRWARDGFRPTLRQWRAAGEHDYCTQMLEIALELALNNRAYEDVASKFFEHFIAIADALNNIGGPGLWDSEDGFYYDQLLIDGQTVPLKLRGMMGIIPLLANHVLDEELIHARLPAFQKRILWFLNNRKDLFKRIAALEGKGDPGHRQLLLALPTRDRLERVLKYMLDENEFLSPFGVRSMSKVYEKHPYTFTASGRTFTVDTFRGTWTRPSLAGTRTGGGRFGCRTTSCSSRRF
jgi:Carboxypeptidase regulatory-like domain